MGEAHFALGRSLRLANFGARRHGADDGGIVEIKRIFKVGCRGRLQPALLLRPAEAGRYTGVQRCRVAHFLLRQLLGRLAQVGLGHFADLEASRPAHFAHHRPRHLVRIRRLDHTVDKAKDRRVLLQMLADDGLLHLLLAPALGEARPLQGDGAAERDELLVQGQEDGGEADARRHQYADQRYSNKHYSGTGGVEIRRRGAVRLAAEVAAGRQQRAADPHFPKAEVEQRRRGDHQQGEADQLGLQELQLLAPETVPAEDQKRGGKENPGEAEKADEQPGHGGAVVADPVRDRGVGGGVERGGVVRVIGEEGEGKADAERQDDDPDQLPTPPAFSKLQQLHHTRHVLRSQEISRKWDRRRARDRRRDSRSR